MTSRSRKKHPTTRPNTTAASPREAHAAAAYRRVDRSTSSEIEPRREPLWLPSGWLAVLLTLASAVPGLADDGWRPKGSAVKATRDATATPAFRAAPTRAFSPAPQTADDGWTRAVRQVNFEEDIAGPALRVAHRSSDDGFGRRGYRVAQQDAGLEEAFERPFGVADEPMPEPDPLDGESSEADRLFDDLPADPYERQAEPADESMREPAPVPDMEPGYEVYEEDDLAGDLSAPFSGDYHPDLEEERAEVTEDCEENLRALKATGIDSISLDIGLEGREGEDYPFTCSIDDGTIFAPREWCEITYLWKASALAHKPLYFEEAHLERYGHSRLPCVQPFVSGLHFFGTLPVLPYCMGLKAPSECVYTLGHYRPGNCAPYLIDPIPFTWRAAAAQTVGVAAVGGILP